MWLEWVMFFIIVYRYSYIQNSEVWVFWEAKELFLLSSTKINNAEAHNTTKIDAGIHNVKEKRRRVLAFFSLSLHRIYFLPTCSMTDVIREKKSKKISSLINTQLNTQTDEITGEKKVSIYRLLFHTFAWKHRDKE